MTLKRELLPLVVLVPVLDRPKSVVPLLDSFSASGAPGLIMFVCDADDVDELATIDRQIVHRPGTTSVLVTNELRTWPRKINAGYRATREPWMLLAADDVRFHAGWWEATEGARLAGAGVIGTQDLGNPSVLRGEHSTHPLVSRAYIDAQGTIDGPCEVVHEGYRHWFCDNEIVETAKARGAWAFCNEAVIEHCHPYWRKAAWDDTYALGEACAAEDRELWMKRAPRIR